MPRFIACAIRARHTKYLCNMPQRSRISQFKQIGIHILYVKRIVHIRLSHFRICDIYMSVLTPEPHLISIDMRITAKSVRSEERRVGKECRGRRAANEDNTDRE